MEGTRWELKQRKSRAGGRENSRVKRLCERSEVELSGNGEREECRGGMWRDSMR